MSEGSARMTLTSSAHQSRYTHTQRYEPAYIVLDSDPSCLRSFILLQVPLNNLETEWDIWGAICR